MLSWLVKKEVTNLTHLIISSTTSAKLVILNNCVELVSGERSNKFYTSDDILYKLGWLDLPQVCVRFISSIKFHCYKTYLLEQKFFTCSKGFLRWRMPVIMPQTTCFMMCGGL